MTQLSGLFGEVKAFSQAREKSTTGIRDRGRFLVPPEHLDLEPSWLLELWDSDSERSDVLHYIVSQSR